MLLTTLSEIAVEFAALSGIPAYLLLQAWTLRHLEGGPRYAALLPVLLALSVIAPCLDTSASHAGPSSAALLLFAPGAALYLAGLACGTRLFVRLRHGAGGSSPLPENAGKDQHLPLMLA